MRSPGSRAKSVRTCQCLRPRRAVWALALSRPSVLPSVTGTTSAPGMRVLSRLNGWPMRSPANASPIPSRASAHDSGVDAVCYSFIVMDLHHLLLAGLPAHSALPPESGVEADAAGGPSWTNNGSRQPCSMTWSASERIRIAASALVPALLLRGRHLRRGKHNPRRPNSIGSPRGTLRSGCAP